MFQQFMVQIPLFSHCQHTFVGGCIVLVKDDFFLLQTGSFLMNFFFCLFWLKDWNNIPWLLFYPFQDNQ
jgi:hypothetical protein